MQDVSTAYSSDADSAVAWYNRSLAKVLGLNPALQPLQAERLSEISTGPERKAVADLIDKRFLRVVDDATGSVTIETVGDALVMIESEADVDPLMAEEMRRYLETARATLAGFEADICLPGACAEEIEGLVWQARGLLDLLIAESSQRESAFLVSTHVHELTSESDGVFARMERLVRTSGQNTVEADRATASLRASRRALACFAEAIADLTTCEDEGTVTETAVIVQRCAGHIAVHVDGVRQVLREAGVGICEIEEMRIKFKSPVWLGKREFPEIGLSEALGTIKSESVRWLELVRLGRGEQIVSVQQSAIVLRQVVASFDVKYITKTLKLDSKSGATVAVRIERMTAYVGSVLTAIIGDGTTSGSGNRQGRRHSASRDDAAAL